MGHSLEGGEGTKVLSTGRLLVYAHAWSNRVQKSCVHLCGDMCDYTYACSHAYVYSMSIVYVLRFHM